MWQGDSTAAKIYPLDVVAGRDDEIKPENRIGLCRISYSWMSEDEFLADIMAVSYTHLGFPILMVLHSIIFMTRRKT